MWNRTPFSISLHLVFVVATIYSGKTTLKTQ